MRGLIFAVVMVLVGGCGAHPSEMEVMEGSTGNLVKETYFAQADQDGLVEFGIPGFDSEEGMPMVQTYEASEEKFRRLLFISAPHALDTLGTVYLETDPDAWVAIVVIRPGFIAADARAN